MTLNQRLVRLLLITALLAAPALAANAKPASQDALFKTVAGLDATLFDAYNRCDLKVMGELITDDLEFYHDKTGLAVGRAPFIKSMRDNICGKVHRDLLAETLEVYPLHGYGAVEIGVHRFCDARRFARCDESSGGDARFVMLWRQDKDGWKLTRVISYDHINRPVGK